MNNWSEPLLRARKAIENAMACAELRMYDKAEEYCLEARLETTAGREAIRRAAIEARVRKAKG